MPKPDRLSSIKGKVGIFQNYSSANSGELNIVFLYIMF